MPWPLLGSLILSPWLGVVGNKWRYFPNTTYLWNQNKMSLTINCADLWFSHIFLTSGMELLTMDIWISDLTSHWGEWGSLHLWVIVPPSLQPHMDVSTLFTFGHIFRFSSQTARDFFKIKSLILENKIVVSEHHIRSMLAVFDSCFLCLMETRRDLYL